MLAGLLGAAAQGEADLEDEQLVVDQAVAGPGGLLAVGGAVDGLQGAGPVGQAVARRSGSGTKSGTSPWRSSRAPTARRIRPEETSLLAG